VVFIVPNVRRPQQIELFEAAPQDIEADSDLLNVALDVAYEDDEIVVRRYPLPWRRGRAIRGDEGSVLGTRN
jgi:hypothetical protein